MSLEILYQDEDIVAVVKPAGITVHGSGDRASSDLESQVSKQLGRKSILLHRLDRDTSGIVLFAMRRTAAGVMSRAFEDGLIRKSYLAVVKGSWPGSVTKIESFIERGEDQKMVSRLQPPGRRSVTTFRVLMKSSEVDLIEASPKTGRTHQIRLHCAQVGHPICGDKLYGESAEPGLQARIATSLTQALHSYRIDFRHPTTEKPIRLYAPLPEFWHKTWLSFFELKKLDEKLKSVFRLTNLK